MPKTHIRIWNSLFMPPFKHLFSPQRIELYSFYRKRWPRAGSGAQSSGRSTLAFSPSTICSIVPLASTLRHPSKHILTCFLCMSETHTTTVISCSHGIICKYKLSMPYVEELYISQKAPKTRFYHLIYFEILSLLSFPSLPLVTQTPSERSRNAISFYRDPLHFFKGHIKEVPGGGKKRQRQIPLYQWHSKLTPCR